MNPNYTEINAKAELANPDSVYHYWAKMIALRHRAPALVYGRFTDLDPANAAVFCYTRVLGNERYLVVLNFSENAMDYTLPEGMKAGKLALSNLGVAEENASVLKLKGWEARVYQY